MTNIRVGKSTVKPPCGPELCPLYGECQTSEGRTAIAHQIVRAVDADDPHQLPIEILAGKGMEERPVDMLVCMHLARIIGTTVPHLDQIPVTGAEQALEWAVLRAFSPRAAINQPRD